MVPMSHIYCRQIVFSFDFVLVAQGMFNLGQTRRNFTASLMSLTHSLFSEKARCFSQSENALYGNFIINYCYGCSKTICMHSVIVIIIIIIIIITLQFNTPALESL